MACISQFFSCLHTARGDQAAKCLIKQSAPNKKHGILWALAAAVAIVADLAFAALAVIGVGLAISAFVTGPVALGLVQLFTTVATVALIALITDIAYNCIKNAQYHFGRSNRPLDHLKNAVSALVKSNITKAPD